VGTLDKPTLAGIALCALPVAAFSAYSQFETARLAGVPTQLAWVFPMATDATAFVSTRVWLDARFSPDDKDDKELADRKRKVRRYAALLTLACIVLSVGGAAAHLAIQGIAVPWLLQLAIGGLPSVALAGLVHLAAIIAAANIATPRRHGKAPKTVGTAGQRPPTPAVPAPSRPGGGASGNASTLERRPLVSTPVGSPEIGKGSVREQMWAYLDANPEFAFERGAGAALDRRFGGKDYGRGVVSAWKKARADRPKASGE
jgi:hypothetical protein